MKQSYYARHQDMLKNIIMECQRNFKNLRLFPATNGLFYTKRGTPVKIGTNGMPDLHGFIGPYAVFIEVKAGKQLIKKASDQFLFQKMCEQIGVIHIVATSPLQAVSELNKQLKDKNYLF